MKARSYLLGSVVLAAVGCSAPPPLDASDDFGGCVAILVDRTFGTWKDKYSQPEGGILGSPPREQRPRLTNDHRYSVKFGFSDGRTIETERSFVAGTTIADVTVELANALRSEGLDVAAVPEFGALRVGFMKGLDSVSAAAVNGFTIETHNGTRRDLVLDGILDKNETVALK